MMIETAKLQLPTPEPTTQPHHKRVNHVISQIQNLVNMGFTNRWGSTS